MTKKDVAIILALSGVLLFTTIVGRWWIGEDAFIITVTLYSIFLLSGLLETYRRLGKRHSSELMKSINSLNNNYRQIEALFSIFSIIKPKFPLPDTRGWAASPDLLKKLVEVIYSEKPKFVVEAGSGVSSLIIAYCLKQIGRGKVVCLDHEPKYAKITEDLISFHGLEDVAKVVHAPLTQIEINGNRWLWYDTEFLEIDEPVDLFVIDGPPWDTQKLARYPALPLLFEYLRDKSTIILDDGARNEEKEIVKIWEKELDYISYDFLSLEKGAFLIKKHSKAKNS